MLMVKTCFKCGKICNADEIHVIDGSFDTDIVFPRDYWFKSLCRRCYLEYIGEIIWEKQKKEVKDEGNS